MDEFLFVYFRFLFEVSEGVRQYILMQLDAKIIKYKMHS
jgi:hypothetical protein